MKARTRSELGVNLATVAPRDEQGGIKWGPYVCACGHLEDEHKGECRGCRVEGGWTVEHPFVAFIEMYDDGMVAPPGYRVIRRRVPDDADAIDVTNTAAVVLTDEGGSK